MGSRSAAVLRGSRTSRHNANPAHRAPRTIEVLLNEENRLESHESQKAPCRGGCPGCRHDGTECLQRSQQQLSNGKVTMTLWQNSTTGPGQQFWKDAAAAFHTKDPNVTIKVQSIQNEDLDGKLQTALNSGDAPDIFLQRGGGKMAAMVPAGLVMDITGKVTSETTQNISEGSFLAKTSRTRSGRCPWPCSRVACSTARTCSPRPVSPKRRRRRRPVGRRHEAEGLRRRSDRARREGRMARSPLVLLVRAPRVLR